VLVLLLVVFKDGDMNNNSKQPVSPGVVKDDKTMICMPVAVEPAIAGEVVFPRKIENPIPLAALNKRGLMEFRTSKQISRDVRVIRKRGEQPRFCVPFLLLSCDDDKQKFYTKAEAAYAAKLERYRMFQTIALSYIYAGPYLEQIGNLFD
jgi:hypothetical protein